MSYELIQRLVRVETGTNGTYAEDWFARFTAAGFTTGTFNERMLAWINDTLGTSYTFLPDAMRAYAEYSNARTWGEIGFYLNIGGTLYERLLDDITLQPLDDDLTGEPLYVQVT